MARLGRPKFDPKFCAQRTTFQAIKSGFYGKQSGRVKTSQKFRWVRDFFISSSENVKYAIVILILSPPSLLASSSHHVHQYQLLSPLYDYLIGGHNLHLLLHRHLQ